MLNPPADRLLNDWPSALATISTFCAGEMLRPLYVRVDADAPDVSAPNVMADAIKPPIRVDFVLMLLVLINGA